MAVDFVGMQLYDWEDDPRFVDVLADALQGLIDAGGEDSEIVSLSQYDFEHVFAYLERHAQTIGVDRLARLEWALLPALGYEPVVPTLHRALAEDPTFFIEVMKVIYKGPDGEADSGTDKHRQAMAENGYRLLSSWREVPGLNGEQVEPAVLQDWLNIVLPALRESGRGPAAERQIGHMLASAPRESDGTWPSVTVRDLLVSCALSSCRNYGMLRTGRPKAVLELTDPEREQLVRWERRRKSSQALALRSRIVSRCAAGVPNAEVAAAVG